MDHPHVIRRTSRPPPAAIEPARVVFGWANLKASVEAEFRRYGLVDDGFRAKRGRRYGAA